MVQHAYEVDIHVPRPCLICAGVLLFSTTQCFDFFRREIFLLKLKGWGEGGGSCAAVAPGGYKKMSSIFADQHRLRISSPNAGGKGGLRGLSQCVQLRTSLDMELK
jgi:hypothetical protein